MSNRIVANLYKYESYPFVRINWIDTLIKEFNADVYSPINQKSYIEILSEIDDNLIVFESNHFSFLYPNALIKRRDKSKFIHFFTDDDQYFFCFSRYFALYYHLSLYTYADIYNQKLYENHGLNSKLVPYGANINYFFPYQNRKKIDVLFIGGSHIPQRVQIIKFLKSHGVNIKVYGYGWEKISGLSDINGGFAKDEDIAKIYSSAKIVINFLGTLEDKCILKGKVFETAMCKTFQIVDKCKEVQYWLKDKESIVFYKNQNDLLEKIEYYLKNRIERENIAENAYKIAKQFTWTNIFKDSFKVIKKYSHIPYYGILNRYKNIKIYILDLDNISDKYSHSLMTNTVIIKNRDINNFLNNIQKINEKFYVSFLQRNTIELKEKLLFQIYSLENDKRDNIFINISSYEFQVKKYFVHKIDFHFIKNKSNLINFIIPSSLMISHTLINKIDLNKVKNLSDIFNKVVKKIENKEEKFRYISLGKELIIVKGLIKFLKYIPLKTILYKIIKRTFKK